MVDLRPSPRPRLICSEGTTEARWEQCPALSGVPELSIDGHALALVVAPHPDDETLALGGTIASMAARGMAVVVVTATDGETSHPQSTVLTPDELRTLRCAESRRALGVLADGHRGNVRNVQLHLPDGELAESHEELTQWLVRHLTPEDVCFATWESDGHPDHEAVGRAAVAACTATGARLLQYPVWTWNWAEPGDESIPWERARRIELSEHERECKQRAIECYRTQILPIGDGAGDAAIVPPYDLAHFQRPFEVVFV